MGYTYGVIGDHQKAIEYRETALKILLALWGENHPDVAIAYHNAGYEYAKLGDYNKALEYQTKGVSSASSINNSLLEATIHNRIGQTYKSMNNVEKAREHFLRAAELFKELGNDKEYENNLELCSSLAVGNES